jgi:phosphoserine phosphatase serB
MKQQHEVIAIVKLASGETGYWDRLSRMRLSRKEPYGFIHEKMDLTNIRKSVRMGRLVLVYGILPAEQGTYSPLIRKLVKSTNYDIVSSGFVNPEEAKEKVAEEAKRAGIIAEAPVVKTEEPKVKKEEVTEDGLQEKGQEGLQVEPEAKAEETITPVETIEEVSVEPEESNEEETTEETSEEKPKKRGRKKASK